MSRQRKGKGVAQSSSNPSLNDTELITPKAPQRFSSYKSEALTKIYSEEKSKIDDGSLEITRCFKYQGLLKFLAMGKYVYPTLLRQMLANAHCPRDHEGKLITDTIATKVNGVDFWFDIEDIVKAFKLTTFSNMEEIMTTNDIPENIVWRHVQESLSPNPQMHKKGGLLATCMHLQCRIIHKIVGQCLLGKTSGFDQVSLLEQYLIFVINGREKRISWAHLILDRIRRGPLRKSSLMPYGFALSMLMIQKEVDVSQATRYELNETVDLIGDKMVSQMGFERDRRNRWVLKQSRRSQASSSSQAPPTIEEEEEEDEENVNYEVPSKISNASIKDTYNLVHAQTEHLYAFTKQQQMVNENLFEMAYRNEYTIKTLYERGGWAYPTDIPSFSQEARRATNKYVFRTQAPVNEPQIAREDEAQQGDDDEGDEESGSESGEESEDGNEEAGGDE